MAFLLTFSTVSAENSQALIQNAVIDDISLVYLGTSKSVTDPFVFAHIAIKKGHKYYPHLIDESIKSLYDTGFFNDVQVKVDVKQKQKNDDHVLVKFILNVRCHIGDISFTGNKMLKDKTLTEELTIKEADPLDPNKIKESCVKITELYQKKGYADVIVDYSTTSNASTGDASVVFHVDEGEKYSVSKIQFVGNKSIKSGELTDVMQTKTWNILSWITGTGKFNLPIFNEDLEHIKKFYQNRGFLDIFIPQNGVQLNKNRGNLSILIPIQEGQTYRLGTIAIQGNTLFPEKTLHTFLKLKPGDILSKEKLDQSCDAIRDYYGTRGYLDSYAIPRYHFNNIAQAVVDITLQIHEGQKCTINSIKLEGNTLTKSHVILREVALAPGDIFDSVRMQNAQARLNSSRLFSEAILTPESTAVPNQKDLKIKVKEGKTGSLQFGGGISSVDKLTTFIEASQNNFDYKNSSTWFRGAGQKAKVRLGLGMKSSQLTLGFEEPWLFDRELAFGFEAFRTTSKYISDYYNENRLGMEWYLRKRLFELVEGRLAYRLEEIDIRDMNMAKVSPTIAKESGKRSVSKIKLLLSRDTTDSFGFPTDGSRIEFDNQVAGGPFGSQTNYLRSEAAAGRWFTVFETCKQVFSLVGRTGAIKGYQGRDVPLADRMFLGGPDNIRGFNYRDVGPKDTKGQPIGGRTFAYASTEYSALLFDPVRLAVFYDIGFVNPEALNWSTKDFNSDWGVGLRIFILGSPLRLDLAFPMKTPASGSKNCKFQYSFGVVF